MKQKEKIAQLESSVVKQTMEYASAVKVAKEMTVSCNVFLQCTVSTYEVFRTKQGICTLYWCNYHYVL